MSTLLGAKSLWDGLASAPHAPKPAASVGSGCTSGGTCPRRLCFALLPDAGPGLEPGVSRLVQC